MGLVTKIASGIDNLSGKAGDAVYNRALNKVRAAEIAKQSAPDIVEKAVADASVSAARQGEIAYGLAQAGIYGAGIGGAVGLVNNVGNDSLGGTIGGTGLGAVGGAGIGAVAAAIARGMR